MEVIIMQRIHHKHRLSIDIDPEEHRLIRVNAAIHNQTIREYVLGAVRKQLNQKIENEDLYLMTTEIGPVLKELWNNKKDSVYDKL